MKKLIALLVLLIMGCSQEMPVNPTSGPSDTAPLVIASNYPLYYFTTALAGSAMDVRLPEIAGDPAMWTPGEQQILQLQKAALIVTNGAGYEPWLGYVTLPSRTRLDTTAGLEERLLPVEDSVVHQHGPEGEHSHADTAFTTWLDPRLAIQQARAIESRLSVLAPELTPVFKTHLSKLEARLAELDGSLERTFEALGDRPVVFSHPVYQYLAHRYRINARSVHWEPEQAPSLENWLALQNLLREHPATVMIWEDAPLAVTSTRLQGVGVHSVVFEPVGNRPTSGDYFSVMEDNIRRLNETLR